MRSVSAGCWDYLADVVVAVEYHVSSFNTWHLLSASFVFWFPFYYFSSGRLLYSHTRSRLSLLPFVAFHILSISLFYFIRPLHSLMHFLCLSLSVSVCLSTSLFSSFILPTCCPCFCYSTRPYLLLVINFPFYQFFHISFLIAFVFCSSSPSTFPLSDNLFGRYFFLPFDLATDSLIRYRECACVSMTISVGMLSVAETWRRVWGGRTNFSPTKMTFFS